MVTTRATATGLDIYSDIWFTVAGNRRIEVKASGSGVAHIAFGGAYESAAPGHRPDAAFVRAGSGQKPGP